MGWMGGSKAPGTALPLSEATEPEVVWGPAALQLAAAWSLPGSAVVSLGHGSNSSGPKELLLPPPTIGHLGMQLRPCPE